MRIMAQHLGPFAGVRAGTIRQWQTLTQDPGAFGLTTKLDSPLKRELSVMGKPYTLTVTPEGFNLALKGRRKGYQLAWADLVSGDAALATALNASLARAPEPNSKPVVAKKRKAKPPAAAARR